MQVAFTNQTNRDAIAQLRIDACEPRLNNRRRIVVCQSLGNLKGEPKPWLYVSVNLSSCRPSVDCANILYTADVRSQLTSEESDKLLDNIGGRHP